MWLTKKIVINLTRERDRYRERERGGGGKDLVKTITNIEIILTRVHKTTRARIRAQMNVNSDKVRYCLFCFFFLLLFLIFQLQYDIFRE